MLDRDRNGCARLGGIPLSDVLDGTAPGASGPVATPAYVYDLDAIAGEAHALAKGFGPTPHVVFYAVKANAAGPVVRALASAGCGADVVSGSELAVALGAGIPAAKIVFSSVAKSDREIDAAIGAEDRGIFAVQMESVEEVARVDARAAALGRKARVSLRVNPGIVADTHAHVATGHDEAKFGIHRDDLADAWDALARARHVELVGLTTHVGSQLTDMNDYLASASALIEVAALREATHGKLELLDLGGGFGIDYGAGCPVMPADFAREAARLVEASPLRGRTIGVEPGRSMVGAHGVLCARVVMAKRSRTGRRWLMIDAGMNDLMRPALYGARHRVESIEASPSGRGATFRVVGPVCESSDDFGEHAFDEPLPSRVMLRDAGAYGFTMASQYNGRALPTEVFLQGGRIVGAQTNSSADEWVLARLRGA